RAGFLACPTHPEALKRQEVLVGDTDRGIAFFVGSRLGIGLTAARAKSVSGQRGDETLGIKDRLILDHEVNRACYFNGHYGIGLKLTTHSVFEPLGQGSNAGVITLGDDGDLAEGPAQVRIAELRPAQALDFAGTGHGAFDQAAVREKILHGGKALNVSDLIENGKAQIFTDSGNGLEQSIFLASNLFGLPLEFFLKLEDLVVEMA